MANAFINLFGMLLLVWWISGFAEIIVNISPKSSLPAGDPLALAETVPRQIANAHTLFNILVAFLLTPVTPLIAKLIDRMLPERVLPEEDRMKAMYLDDNMISTPALGLNLAKQEALRIGSIVQDMVSDAILPFLLKESNVLEDLSFKEKQIDSLSEEVHSYLKGIIRQSVERGRAEEAFQIMYAVKELEEIADTIGNLLVTRADIWLKSDAEFSQEGKKELVEYHTMAQKQLARALDVFRDLNLEKAKAMKAKHKKYRSVASEFEKKHYERLRNSDKLIEESGDTHMELMTRFRTITHHSTNIARILLEWKETQKSLDKKKKSK
jgi:phosphate:Na+ symporter